MFLKKKASNFWYEAFLKKQKQKQIKNKKPHKVPNDHAQNQLASTINYSDYI